MDEDIRKNTPVSAKQTGKCEFEVKMLDGSVRKFYRGDVTIHYVVPNDPNPKITFNLIEI